jgi:hypothetical protein
VQHLLLKVQAYEMVPWKGKVAVVGDEMRRAVFVVECTVYAHFCEGY